MILTAKYAICLSQLFAITWSSSLAPILSPRSCGTKIPVSSLYNLIRPGEHGGGDNPAQDTSSRYTPGIYDFFVSQDRYFWDDGGTLFTETDLIATYTNIPCPPAGKNPYRLEFYFQPTSDYGNGYPEPGWENFRVDVWAINGALPRNSTGGLAMTWDNMQGLTGAKVGSLNMPTATREIEQIIPVTKTLSCKKELSFRLSMTDDGGRKKGFIRYPMGAGNGLRIRYGC